MNPLDCRDTLGEPGMRPTPSLSCDPRWGDHRCRHGDHTGPVRRCRRCGADFVVSPVHPPFLLPAAAEAGVLAVPGCATPHEIWTALDAGALAVKVFPAARLGGPAYLRDFMSPPSSPHIMAGGGIGIDDLPDHRRAGAWGVALGRNLSGSIPEGNGATAPSGQSRPLRRDGPPDAVLQRPASRPRSGAAPQEVNGDGLHGSHRRRGRLTDVRGRLRGAVGPRDGARRMGPPFAAGEAPSEPDRSKR